MKQQYGRTYSNSYTYDNSSYNGLCNSAAATKISTAATAACIGGSKSSCNKPSTNCRYTVATKASNETTAPKYYNLQVTKVKLIRRTLNVKKLLRIFSPQLFSNDCTRTSCLEACKNRDFLGTCADFPSTEKACLFLERSAC